MFWWLASYPKSGNTWMRAMISAYITGDIDLNAMSDLLQDDVLPELWNRICPFDVADLQGHHMAALRPCYLLSLAEIGRQAEAECMWLKTHNMACDIDGIPLFPKIETNGAIYLVRDPRDVAVSWAHHMGKDIAWAITSMAKLDATRRRDKSSAMQLIGSWSSNVASWHRTLPFSRLTIRYEDVLADPLGSLRKALKFCNIKLDEQKLRQAVEATTFDKLKAAEQEKGFIEAPGDDGDKRPFFRQGKSGGWRDVLTPAQISAIERDHGSVMDKLGYERVFGR